MQVVLVTTYPHTNRHTKPRSRRPVRFPFATHWLLCCCLFMAVAGVNATARYPLEPIDLSSPRATLETFFTNIDKTLTAIASEDFRRSPTHAQQRELWKPVTRALRTIDLSEVAPSTRIEAGLDAASYLYEVLSRIELPPMEAIPDAASFGNGEGPARWTIPHTEISIVRIGEGNRRGEFVFSPATAARAEEFYLEVRNLPHRRAVPIDDIVEFRKILPGWMIPITSIERLPDWTKTTIYGQAVWKLIAFTLLLTLIFAFLVFLQRRTRRGLSGDSANTYARRLILPIVIFLLMPVIAYLATEQINLVGGVAKGVKLITEAVGYLVATWAAWLGLLWVAELLISSPKIGDNSLNAQLLRLTARIGGIIAGLVIIFYGANQVGIPLVGVLAGVGVGGLAIALAAQDSLKNLLGSLMIFMDQPYKPGQRIVVQGHDGFVEQIGLRSTKLRMLTGALTAIPNEKMASLDIENIGRRDFIRRQTSIRLAYDTPPEQIETAVGIVKDILRDHEGMRPQLPPRVFFDEFNPDSFNLFVSYWYHPPKRWKSMQFDERVNLEIVRRFATAGIRFALPASASYLTQREGESIRLDVNKDN